MANNEYVNKVIYGNQTLMDITDTTADESTVASGEIFYKASGERSTGTANYVKTITFNGTTNQPDANNDISLSESDPTVPAWAKASTKPDYTASEVGALPNPYIFDDVDLRQSDNDIESEEAYVQSFNDKNGKSLSKICTRAYPDGSTELNVYVGNASTSATIEYLGGITITMEKDSGGFVNYNITSPSNFRSAISVYSKSEIDGNIATLSETKTYLGIT